MRAVEGNEMNFGRDTKHAAVHTNQRGPVSLSFVPVLWSRDFVDVFIGRETDSCRLDESALVTPTSE